MSLMNDKAKNIRLLILDVDGILTTGIVYYISNGSDMRGFNLHDGLGIKLLQKTGVKVAVISAKNSEAVARRLAELKVEHIYLGQEEKLEAYQALKQKLALSDEQIAYMGDDLPDLPVLKRVGFSITVPQAPAIIQQHVDLTTKNKGGKGAVREICEFIMQAQDSYQTVIQSYLA